MKSTHNLNMELIYALFSVQSHSRQCEEMQKFLDEYLSATENISYHFDKTGNIYVTKGQSDEYPCVVSHIDTVHAISKDGLKVVHYDDDIIFGVNPRTLRNSGIGGDDKCGIFACLYALESLDAVKLAFFVDEEIGCQGSCDAEMDFFKDCRFILQADRRGNNDFVNDICGSLSSKDFQNDVLPIIQEHGYKFAYGALTDVMELRNKGAGISCANMSAAYYNPHMDNEYVVLSELENVCEMIVKICTNLTKVYPHVYTVPTYGRYGGGWDTEEYYGHFGHNSTASAGRFPTAPALGYGNHINQMSPEDKAWYEENMGMEELEEESVNMDESDADIRIRKRLEEKINEDIAAYFPQDPPSKTSAF